MRDIISRMDPERRESLERISKLTPRERVQRNVDSGNSEQGDLHLVDGYDCKICLNKGFVFEVVEIPPRTEGGEPTYTETTKDCKCRKVRSNIRRMKKSGLENIISRCTFEKYEATEEWQKVIKKAAMDFACNVDKLEHKWFFIGGGIGTGKTHLCTAISRDMLYKGRDVRYMLWVDESNKLKACVNDDAKYSEMIEPIKKAEVLYIDDFFKIMRDGYGQELKPTAADIRLAYEIINHRYQQPGSITIISSERHISELEEIDSAVGSRIYEMTKQNAYNIAREPGRNYRTKDMNVI